MIKSTLLNFLVIFAFASVVPMAHSQPASTAGGSSTSTPNDRATLKNQRKANHKLSVDVRRALAKGGIDTSSVVVQANAGALTLIGDVPDNTQIARAEQLARDVAGVTSVSNKLTIRSGI